MFSQLDCLSQEESQPVYLCVVKDSYLKNEIVRRLTERFFCESSSHEETFYFREEGSLPILDLIDQCLSLPLFSEKKLVFCDLFSDVFKDKLFWNYLENPSLTTCLVLFLNDARRLSKRLKQHSSVLSFGLNDKKSQKEWINQTIQTEEITITSEAQFALIENTANDFSKLSQDLEKLMLFVGTKGTITRKVFDEVISSSAHDNVFELVEMFFQPHYKIFSQKLRMSLLHGKTGYEITGLLLWFLRRLLSIKNLLHQKTSIKDIAKTLNAKEWAIKKNMSLAKKIETQAFKEYFSFLYQVNIDLRKDEKGAIFLLEKLFFDFKEMDECKKRDMCL